MIRDGRMYSARQEEADLFEEALRRLILFQQNVIAALKRDELGARDFRGKLPSQLKRDLTIAPCMHHQRRDANWGRRAATSIAPVASK